MPLPPQITQMPQSICGLGDICGGSSPRSVAA